MSFPVAFSGNVLPRNYRQFEDGAAAPAAPLSPAGQGIIRYNDTTRTFQVSINGAAYADLAVAGDAGFIGGNSGASSIAFGISVFALAINHSIVESQKQFIATRSGVLRNLFAQADANTLDASTVLTLRINGLGTAVRVSIPALSTAQFSDLVNTAPVAQGDLISLEVDTLASTVNSIVRIAYGYQLASA